MRVKKIALLLFVFFVLVQLPGRLQAQSNTAGENSFKNLHHLMEEGIHERFTYLSFTLWHDSPMTPEKMDTIAKSAMELRQMAESIPTFIPRYLNMEWAKEDENLFTTRATELSKVSQRLAEAASKRDKKGTEKLFKQLEASCRDCHNTFNKALKQK